MNLLIDSECLPAAALLTASHLDLLKPRSKTLVLSSLLANVFTQRENITQVHQSGRGRSTAWAADDVALFF